MLLEMLRWYVRYGNFSKFTSKSFKIDNFYEIMGGLIKKGCVDVGYNKTLDLKVYWLTDIGICRSIWLSNDYDTEKKYKTDKKVVFTIWG